MDKGQQKSWKSAFTWYEHTKQVENSWADATLKNPHKAVWLAIFMFVAQNVIKIGEIKGKAQIKRASEQTVEQILNESV